MSTAFTVPAILGMLAALPMAFGSWGVILGALAWIGSGRDCCAGQQDIL